MSECRRFLPSFYLILFDFFNAEFLGLLPSFIGRVNGPNTEKEEEEEWEEEEEEEEVTISLIGRQ